MRLLFFDIECASVTAKEAKICAFGYVLCDTSFRLLKKEDILINPRGGFHLTDPKGEKGLVLPYRQSQFRKCPTFYNVYKRIRSLLEDRDNMVIGHAIQNDVKYLNLDRQRYHLPAFNFDYYDTQLLYMEISSDYSHQSGLETIATSLGVKYTPHMAADDAYATMKIAETMCRPYNGSFEYLLSKVGARPGHIDKNGITLPSTVEYEKYCIRSNERKEERLKIRTCFFQYLSEKKVLGFGKLSGCIFNFSRRLEDDMDRVVPLIDYIYENGGEYTQKISECNIYVRDVDDETARTVKAYEAGLKIITPEEIGGLNDV